MPSYVLKKILPFSLTLIIGVLLGSAFGVFNSRATHRARHFRSHGYAFEHGRGYGGCKKSSPVVYTYEPNTRYTKEAWEKGVTGTVRLRVTFGADGEIKDVVPVLRLPHGLTEEAEKVARRAKFIPARENGTPVTVTKEVDYVFSLNDRMAAGL